MLLLLISLFSNYDLFHCNHDGQANFQKTQLSAQMHRSIRKIDTLLRDFQQEIQIQKLKLRTADLEDNLKDVGLFDYSITPIWWGGTPGVNQTGRNNPAITFLPTPVGHGMTNSSEDKDQQHTENLWENLKPIPGIPSSVPLNVIAIPGHVPDHPGQPSFTFSTFSPSPKLPPHISFTRPAYPFPVPPRTSPGPFPVPAPVIENFNEDYLPGSPTTRIGPLKPILPTRPSVETNIPTSMAAPTRLSPLLETTTRVSTLSLSPPLSPSVLRGPFAYNPKISTIFNFLPMSKRIKGRTDYTPNKRITKANRITPTTHRPREVGSTLSKAQAWVRNRQWTKTSKAGRTNKERTKKGLRTSVPDLLQPTEYVEITAFTGEIIQEDAQGFLYVSIPAVIPEQVTSPPTTAGDVLIFARNFTRPSSALVHPNKVYYDLMDEWDEGYMMVFLLKVSQLITVKGTKDLRDVLPHAELIMNKFYETGEIAWFGERIMGIAMRICGFCTEAGSQNIDVLRTYAGLLHQMMRERDTAVSGEINSIIDYADIMYEDDEGEALFDAVREFEEYPNVTKTSREICLNLMLTFLRPYKRLKPTKRFQRLLDSVNKALIQRFGERRADGELLMLGDTATAKPNYSIERKGINNSLKRRINIKRHVMNRTKHHSNEDTYRRQIIQAAEDPMLRSVLPITRHQKRFRVITPRQFRSNAYLNNERPTKDYFNRRLGRPIHPPNGMLQFFPQATKESKNNRRMQPTEGR